jgi:hypothetical protein
MRGHHLGGALIIAFSAAVFGESPPLLAYLKLGIEVDGQERPLKWTQSPVHYFVGEVEVQSISRLEFRDTVRRAFSAWESLPDARITYQFDGFTSASPSDDDFRSTLGFEFRPELDRVLASTSFLIDVTTGELVESDIFFNSAFLWSASRQGVPNRFDLETIAVHEIGHFNGLGHSAIGETEQSPGGRNVTATAAVMFPIAFGPGSIVNRVPQPDDSAGIFDLYAAAEPTSRKGSISGRVTMNGRGVFGAHVVAFDLNSGSLIGNFSLNAQGQFAISGLSEGPHVVRVEPLDDVDVESFFSGGQAELNFRPAFYPQLVIVAPDSNSAGVDIAVVRK